jgi:hypothetical protein
MPGNSTYFVTPSLKFRRAADILNHRLHRPGLDLKSGGAGVQLVNRDRAKNYPKSEDGKLSFDRFYKPAAASGNSKMNYYSPAYQVKMIRSGNIQLPAIEFEWIAGAVVPEDEEQEVAVLRVSIERTLSKRAGNHTRIIKHEISLSFVFFSQDEEKVPRSQVCMPFDQVVEQPGGYYTAFMRIKGMKKFSQVFTAMNKPECKASIRLSATAALYVPQIQYTVDLNSFNSTRFHAALREKGFVAKSVMNNPGLHKTTASPVKKTQWKLELAKPGVTTAPRNTNNVKMKDDLQPVNPLRLTDMTRREPVRVSAPLRITDMTRMEPVRVSDPLRTREWRELRIAPNSRSLNRNSGEGTIDMHYIADTLKPKSNLPSLRDYPFLRYSLPPATRMNTTFKTVTTVNENLEKKSIKKELKTSLYKIGGKKAVPLTRLKEQNGNDLYVIKRTGAVIHFPCFYSILNYGQIFRQIPKGIIDYLRGIKDPTLLIRHNISVDHALKVVYQDPLQTNLFYYMPESFKLGRADNPPYEPLLRIGFKELLLDEETEDEVNLNYRVEFTFTALPQGSKEFYAAVRSDAGLKQAAGNQEVCLSPLNTDNVTLDLKGFTESFHAEISSQTASLTSGVMVTCEMGCSDFDRFFATLTGDAGVAAIRGILKARLEQHRFGNVALSISLFDTVGPVFSQVVYCREEDPRGVYRVSLRNEIESKINVSGCRVWVTSNDPRARGFISPGDARFVAGPGETKELRVTVRPAGAVVENLEVETTSRVELDIESLWKRVTLNQGFSSYAFEVRVIMAEPELFGLSPAEGIPPLTALRVEFEDGPEVELTEELPETTALLYKSLLADLQDKPMTEIYRYRVINIHGNEEWARGNWNSGTGTLRAAPVRPGL